MFPDVSKISSYISLSLFHDSYEFKVKPKNELGVGPPSEPVSFNTESGTVPLNSTALHFKPEATLCGRMLLIINRQTKAAAECNL